MLRQPELVDRVRAYHPDVDEDFLNRAYVYATKMHGGQRRASGDPYYSHPVEVAGILTELKLDSATIATALLHDTLEDTHATAAQIKRMFGEEVLNLVDGVTKLSRLERVTDEAMQAENFRKMLVATARDIRVLLVKLADRLHNMRTLHYIKEVRKRRRIAQETLDIYAPLAGRMGMQAFREEMESLAFAELHPKAEKLLRARIAKQADKNLMLLDDIRQAVEKRLREHGLKAKVTARKKSLFSIWQKIERKETALEQLSDIYGVRVVVTSEDECYRALGVLHRSWACVPGRTKDYISLPKNNGYRSLHTTVQGPHEQRVEFQLRTHDMHELAENGVAAHWAYKERTPARRNAQTPCGTHTQSEFDDLQQFLWLRDMVKNFQKDVSAEEFMEHTKMELFSDQVFCFTPQGRLIILPRGAVAIDFAYGVHTEIGHSARGVRVNGQAVPLREKLNNGDEVEILRARRRTVPPASWENIVRTGKARAAIRRARQAQLQREYRKLGKDALQSLFVSEGRKWEQAVVERALGPFALKSLDALYAAIGKGELSGQDVLRKIFPTSRTRRFLRGAVRALANRVTRSRQAVAMPISGGLHGEAISFAQNCFALPGDKIVGIRQPDRSLLVYPAEARRLSQYESKPKRFVPLQWKAELEDAFFASRLKLTLANQIGSMSMVTQTIADYGINISNLAILRRDSDFYDLQIDVEVQNVRQVEKLMAALRGSRVVSKIARIIAGDAP